MQPYAGGLLNCTILACTTVLQHFCEFCEFCRTDVEVLGTNDMIVHRLTLREPIPLALHHTGPHTYCIIIAFYRGAHQRQPPHHDISSTVSRSLISSVVLSQLKHVEIPGIFGAVQLFQHVQISI